MDPIGVRLRKERRRLLGQLTEESGPGFPSARAADPESAGWARLQRLDALIELRDRIRLKSQSRWLIPVCLFIAGMIALLLLLRPVGEVDVDISVVTRSVAFETRTDAIVLDPTPVVVVRYEGPLILVEGSATCDDIEISRATGPIPPTVDALEVPAGTHVAIEMADQRTVDLSLSSRAGARLETSASLPIDTQIAGCVDRRTSRPTQLLLRASTPDLAFAMQLPTAAQPRVGFHTPFEVTALSLARVEHLHEGRPRTVSSLMSGTVYFESLGDAKHDLREGQLLSLEVRHGTIEMMRVTGGALEMRFRGRVARLALASGGDSIGLMPSYLRRWATHPERALLYSASSWVFLLLLAIRRWWAEGRP